jgi:hypothetical protein
MILTNGKRLLSPAGRVIHSGGKQLISAGTAECCAAQYRACTDVNILIWVKLTTTPPPSFILHNGRCYQYVKTGVCPTALAININQVASCADPICSSACYKWRLNEPANGAFANAGVPPTGPITVCCASPGISLAFSITLKWGCFSSYVTLEHGREVLAVTTHTITLGYPNYRTPTFSVAIPDDPDHYTPTYTPSLLYSFSIWPVNQNWNQNTPFVILINNDYGRTPTMPPNGSFGTCYLWGTSCNNSGTLSPPYGGYASASNVHSLTSPDLRGHPVKDGQGTWTINGNRCCYDGASSCYTCEPPAENPYP